MRAGIFVAAAAGLVLAGCGTPQLQAVKVPVAIECRANVPDRPVMPTDALTEGSALDAIVAAALAEIELREGYELKLRGALDECTRPLGRKLESSRVVSSGGSEGN